jgi:hypothetical protein
MRAVVSVFGGVEAGSGLALGVIFILAAVSTRIMTSVMT